jgi:hypothetical protein
MGKYFLIITAACLINTVVGGQNLGIGISNPVHSTLEVQGAVGRTVAVFGADKYGVGIGMNPPFAGFNYLHNGNNLVIKAGLASLLSLDTSNGDLSFGNFNNSTGASDFGAINNYQTRLLIKQNGLVGLGTSAPQFPLTVYGGSNDYGIMQESPDASARVGFFASVFESGVTTTGTVPLNFSTGNGTVKLQLRNSGDLYAAENININEKLTSPVTGTTNLLPVAMGKISATGTILSATPGVFVSRTANGNYSLSFSFEPNLYANRDNYVLQLSTETNTNAVAVNYAFLSDNTIFIKTWRPYIAFSNSGCTCGGGTPSLISGSTTQWIDCVFSFILRKY